MANWTIRLALAGFMVSASALVMASPPALAHSLSSDGNISAFLHIAPTDKPQAGKLNDIFVYYNDQQFKFITGQCDCQIKVFEGNHSLYSGILPAVGTRTGELRIVLPKNNYSYGVVVSGQPITPKAFQAFNLKFDIDVGNPTSQPAANSRLFIPLTASIALAGSANYWPAIKKLINNKLNRKNHE